MFVQNLTDNEIDFIVYYREFRDWFAALSAPARRTLALLPADRQLLIADRSITHRLNHEGIQSVLETYAPTKFKERVLIAA